VEGIMRFLMVMGLALCAGLSACSSGSGGSDGTEGTAGPSGSRDVISAAELETVHNLDALLAIERLRPSWLMTRGPVSIQNQASAGIKVYLNGSPQGGVEALTFIRANALGEMRFLSSREATTRFGTGHPDGAILLFSRSGAGG